MERIVTFDDIRDVLIVFNRPVATNMLFKILEDFGAHIYGQVFFVSCNIRAFKAFYSLYTFQK